MAATEPNILVVQTDQHNRAFAGCYGHGTVRTPAIDRLAREGMRFTDAYCPAPLCVPSRMSFMTGRRPTANRVWNNRQLLHSGVPTWAHVLGSAGYETALIGRMHFDGPDQRHGFERRPLGELGFTAGHPGHPSKLWSGTFRGTSGQIRNGVEVAGTGPTKYQWFDQRVTEAARDYLREQARHGDGPFAAVVGYVLPHCPFVAPEELFEYYYERVEIPDVEDDQPASIRRFRADRDLLDPPLSEERIRVARAAYCALCAFVDRQIGAVLAELDRQGLAENTLVVYCSDHGEMAGEHGCWWKSNFYEGSAGVPLVARLPDEIEAGTTADAVINLHDLAPTFADAAGTAFETPVAGRSLWPTLRGEHPDDWVDETTSEFVSHVEDVGPARMLRSGRWKLWDYPHLDCPPALFDLEADPGERTDLGESPDHETVREDLLAKLYDGWEPDRVAREAVAATRDYRALVEWGQRVDPDHPDALDATPPDYTETDDIDLR